MKMDCPISRKAFKDDDIVFLDERNGTHTVNATIRNHSK